MEVAVQIIGNTMIINYAGKTTTLMKSDLRFNQIVEKMRAEDYEAIPAILGRNDIPEFEYKNRAYYFQGEPLPDSLAKKIMEFREENLPYTFLTNFFRKLKQNPNPRSIEMLYQFLEHNGHPITKDGNFIAYRYVTADFKDCHTGTMDNRVGCVVSMPRDDVDSDPERTCSRGLHVASWEYVKGEGTIVEVSVDPRDVVCVPNDYNGTKMRVCRFVVEAVSKGKESAEVLYGHETKAVKEEKVKKKVRKEKTLKDRFQKVVHNDKSLTLIQYRSGSVLTVTTVCGNKWRFREVSPLVASQLANSLDVGRYYRQNIMKTYKKERV